MYKVKLCCFSICLLFTFLPKHHAFQVSKEGALDRIHQISTNENGIKCLEKRYELVAVPVPTQNFKSVEEKALLSANLIGDTQGLGNHQFIYSTLNHLLRQESSIIDEARIVSLEPLWCTYGTKETSASRNADFSIKFGNESSGAILDQAPWMLPTKATTRRNFLSNNFMSQVQNEAQMEDSGSYWTYPYYSCEKKAWKISFVSTITESDKLAGFVSFDVDISHLDIDQCDQHKEAAAGKSSSLGSAPPPPTSIRHLSIFSHTHKCHPETSQCIFQSGYGWIRGGYLCQCQPGFYSQTGQDTFNGSLVEVAYEAKMKENADAYDKLYVCARCQEGCETCIDDKPCLAPYNWTFRYIVLMFSLACTLATFILVILVYRFRKLKVFRLGSPTFLSITLLGCSIMYLEMLAIFPYLDVGFCIATKWTRNLGFLVTYSALLLKTWRVNLTFRVKSAHKLKLTDKQLLQWLFPILLVMLVYLSSWTFSDPPQAVFIEDGHGLKFKICFFGMWDHCLAAGEFFFLLWGIKVCFSVRKARTHYNEAKWITWSIYNIALVNIIMVAIHLFLLPNAGPDMKYFLGFLRTQLSTTVTIILVFGPKFYRLARGTANELDDRIRARGNAASMIEVPLEKEASQKDVYAENEELKEEIQKLAGQIEYLKIVGMLMENRHIKPRKDGYFSKENCSRHFQHFLVRNGTVINCSGNKKALSNDDPNSAASSAPAAKCGHPVQLLTEKSKESVKLKAEKSALEPFVSSQNDQV